MEMCKGARLGLGLARENAKGVVVIYSPSYAWHMTSEFHADMVKSRNLVYNEARCSYEADNGCYLPVFTDADDIQRIVDVQVNAVLVLDNKCWISSRVADKLGEMLRLTNGEVHYVEEWLND